MPSKGISSKYGWNMPTRLLFVPEREVEQQCLQDGCPGGSEGADQYSRQRRGRWRLTLPGALIPHTLLSAWTFPSPAAGLAMRVTKGSSRMARKASWRRRAVPVYSTGRAEADLLLGHGLALGFSAGLGPPGAEAAREPEPQLTDAGPGRFTRK